MKKLWKFMKAVVFVVIIFVVLICAIGMKQKHRKQKNSTYIWPDNALTAMIPKPESKKGEVTFETKDTFSIDVYKTSKKEYNNYVNDCKKKGFTENYYGTDDHYSADHADGFSLRLSYNSTDKEMSIRISKKLETTTVNSTDTEESVAEDVEADNSDKTEAEETTENTTEESKHEGVTPDFKELMDSYETFFDSYVDFMNKYNEASSDDQAGMLADYADFMTKYADYMKKLDDIDENNLSAADYAYYIKVQARITKKLSEVKM